jgi:hypothetical protein
MYPINFVTASATEVITRSVVCHPSMLVEALRHTAGIHATAAASTYDRETRRIAAKVALECREAAALIKLEGEYAIGQLSFGQRISVFSRAAHLQLIPPAVAQDIADHRFGEG